MQMRLWRTCSMEPEGRVVASGDGFPDLYERFLISANGQEVEMIILSVVSDRTWTAQDVASYEREHRVEAMEAKT